MKYSVKRFSYGLIEGVNDGREYINSQIDSSLEGINKVSTKITEDSRLKDLKPVKRYGGFVRNLSYLLRRKKKKHNNNQ
jgi:hypothetical protein